MNKNDKLATFFEKHGVALAATLGGIVIIIVAWKPLKAFIQGIFAPFGAVGAVLNTPGKIIKALDENMTAELQAGSYQLALDYVRDNAYNPAELAAFNKLPLTDAKKSYLMKIWKLPHPIPVPTYNNVWDVVDLRPRWWDALDTVIIKNYVASEQSTFDALPFNATQKDYLMKIWKQRK